MASTNAIRIAELNELKRKNSADIENAKRKLSIDEATLSETIANNLRNYDINISKNDITRLANEQLNDRELQQMAQDMYTKLLTYYETQRHNMTTEQQKNVDQALERLNILLSNGKPQGKDLQSIIASYFLNQANLQAFAGTNSISEISKQLQKYLTTGDVGDALSNVNSDNGTIPGKHRGTPKSEQESESRSFSGGRNSNSFSGGQGGYYSNVTGRTYDTIKEKREDEKNEIPTDTSSSKGPSTSISNNNIVGGNNYETNTSEKENTASSRYSDSRGPGYNLGESTGSSSQSTGSSERSKSKVIWSSNSGKQVGPGV